MYPYKPGLLGYGVNKLFGQMIQMKVPFYLQVEQKRAKTDPAIFEDLNMPISYIETKCENKNCRSTEKVNISLLINLEVKS